jgi:hypothetical protein
MTCNNCGKEEFYYMIKGDHIGMFCDNCNAWLDWVKKTPEVLANLRDPPKNKELF